MGRNLRLWASSSASSRDEAGLCPVAQSQACIGGNDSPGEEAIKLDADVSSRYRKE